jgi:hypothetical protein
VPRWSAAKANYAGVAIPYFFPGTSEVREYRLRRDHPDMEIDGHGRVKPKQKYLSPPGRGNMLYFAPGVTDAQLRDFTLPLIITEGEFKTLALRRLANWNSDRLRFLPVGVSGVYNWRGTIGKTNGPDGERLDVKEPIPIWSASLGKVEKSSLRTTRTLAGMTWFVSHVPSSPGICAAEVLRSAFSNGMQSKAKV